MQPATERPALIIRPGVSRRLRQVVLALHGLTLLVVLMLPLAWPWRTLLVLALLVGLAGSLGGAVGHRWPWVPRQAVWHPEGGWTLTLGDGREVSARLLATTYISPALVVLNFRLTTRKEDTTPGWRQRWPRGSSLPGLTVPWATRSLVLLPDNLDPDLLRRLRVRLRQEGHCNDHEPMDPGGKASSLGPWR